MDLCKTELCTGCAACANACPKQCIQMIADEEGFLRPIIHAPQCVGCGACQNACPILNAEEYRTDTIAYAAFCKDDDIRMGSTSGGVFTVLCQWVFEHDGVVFGAAYANDFSVEHRCIRSIDELSALRTAKYSQSRISDSFQQVKQLLNDGQYVLFSGTPCQIGGLRTFLGKEYDKLFLVDVICHGVPSPAVWTKYIDYRSRMDACGAAPVAINLRSKKSGWPSYSVCFQYQSGISYNAQNSIDPFLRAFVGDLCLRPSCYDCQFKGISRNSDFTLGDYWGVWSQEPDFNDNKGTSLVLIHTEKANEIWNEITEKMCCKQVNPMIALGENPSATYSPIKPENRQKFMNNYTEQDFDGLVNTLCPIQIPQNPSPIWKRALNKVRRLISTGKKKG